MKLIIKRDQKAHTGLLGGHKGMIFQLVCRVELTPEEHELITKYKAEHHPLTYTTDRDGKEVTADTVGSLTRGVSQEMKNITILLENEESIKRACRNFKILLEVMATFGGEEVIEF